MEQTYKQELQNTLEWLEASKEDMVGETATNVLFVIEKIKKILLITNKQNEIHTNK